MNHALGIIVSVSVSSLCVLEANETATKCIRFLLVSSTFQTFILKKYFYQSTFENLICFIKTLKDSVEIRMISFFKVEKICLREVRSDLHSAVHLKMLKFMYS